MSARRRGGDLAALLAIGISVLSMIASINGAMAARRYRRMIENLYRARRG